MRQLRTIAGRQQILDALRQDPALVTYVGFFWEEGNPLARFAWRGTVTLESGGDRFVGSFTAR